MEWRGHCQWRRFAIPNLTWSLCISHIIFLKIFSTVIVLVAALKTCSIITPSVWSKEGLLVS